MPFRATLRRMQWSELHMLTGDTEMGCGSRSANAHKRGSGGSFVWLQDFLGSLAKCVDVSIAPVGFKLAAGSSMFALLHWDYQNVQWVACTDSFGRDVRIGGEGEGSGGGDGGDWGGVQHWLQPDNMMSTLMGHTLGGSWREWYSFHESSLAHVYNAGHHFIAYVAIPLHATIVVGGVVTGHSDVGMQDANDNLLEWFPHDAPVHDFTFDDLGNFDLPSDNMFFGEAEALKSPEHIVDEVVMPSQDIVVDAVVDAEVDVVVDAEVDVVDVVVDNVCNVGGVVVVEEVGVGVVVEEVGEGVVVEEVGEGVVLEEVGEVVVVESTVDAEVKVVGEKTEPYCDAERMSLASTPVAALRVCLKPRHFADSLSALVKTNAAKVDVSAGAAPRVQLNLVSSFSAKIALARETTARLLATLAKMRESQTK